MTEVKRGAFRYRTAGQDNWRTKSTAGLYQHHSRFSSQWEKPQGEIGPGRAVLMLLGLCVLLVAVVTVVSHAR